MMRYVIAASLFLLIMTSGCTSSETPEDNDDKNIIDNEAIVKLQTENQTLSDELSDLKIMNQEYLMTIDSLNQEIADYEERIKDYILDIEQNDLEDAYFDTLANMSLEFVRAYTSGDIDKLQELTDDTIEYYYNDKDIYCRYTYEGVDIEHPVYIDDRAMYYKDMVIQGYGYLEEEDSYIVHIAVFQTEDSPYFGGTFLNLYFKISDGYWKVSMLEFDI